VVLSDIHWIVHAHSGLVLNEILVVLNIHGGEVLYEFVLKVCTASSRWCRNHYFDDQTVLTATKKKKKKKKEPRLHQPTPTTAING
jgi:hypothetical protein